MTAKWVSSQVHQDSAIQCQYVIPPKTRVGRTQRYILNSFCKTGFCVGTACHLDADETKVRTEAGRSDRVRMSDAAMVCMVLMKEGPREFGQRIYIGRSLAQSGTFGMSTRSIIQAFAFRKQNYGEMSSRKVLNRIYSAI